MENEGNKNEKKSYNIEIILGYSFILIGFLLGLAVAILLFVSAIGFIIAIYLLTREDKRARKHGIIMVIIFVIILLITILSVYYLGYSAGENAGLYLAYSRGYNVGYDAGFIDGWNHDYYKGTGTLNGNKISSNPFSYNPYINNPYYR